MTKRTRRTPKYKRDDPVFMEQEAKKKAGFPPDAVAADVSQQAPNTSYSQRPFYRDVEFKCVDCGREDVWTATQQKWWYEVAKGSIYSEAKRCGASRAALRAKHGGTPRISQEERKKKECEPPAPQN